MQLTRAVQAVAQSGYRAECDRKQDQQIVEERDWASRWMLTTRTTGETPRAGGKRGDIALVVTMYNDRGETELVFDCADDALVARVREEYEARIGAVQFTGSDITRWLNEVHREHLGAVRYGFGWYVPRRTRQIAEQICTVFWNEEHWGDAWCDPPLPVASTEQLAMGISNGLVAEVAEVMADLIKMREKIRPTKGDPKADIGPRAAETFMIRFARVGAHVVTFTHLLSADHLAHCREAIHDAMVELDTVLEGGVTEGWNGIWSGIEAAGKRAA